MKVAPVVDHTKRAENASLRLPSMLDSPFLQSIDEINNFVSARDYAYVSQLPHSGRFDLVKKIATSVMRTVPLFNQLVVDLETFFASVVLSREVTSLRTRYNPGEVKKVGIKRIL